MQDGVQFSGLNLEELSVLCALSTAMIGVELYYCTQPCISCTPTNVNLSAEGLALLLVLKDRVLQTHVHSYSTCSHAEKDNNIVIS